MLRRASSAPDDSRGRRSGAAPACSARSACSGVSAVGSSGVARRGSAARSAHCTSGGECPGRSSTCLLLLSTFSSVRECGIQVMPVVGTTTGSPFGLCGGRELFGSATREPGTRSRRVKVLRPAAGTALPSATMRLAYQATMAAERRGPSLSVKCVNASTSFPSAAGPRNGPTWRPIILLLEDRSVKTPMTGSRARRRTSRLPRARTRPGVGRPSCASARGRCRDPSRSRPTSA